jgi:hypothetical protein
MLVVPLPRPLDLKKPQVAPVPPASSPPSLSMPSNARRDSTPEGSPSRHVLPLLPPHPDPLDALSRWPHFETQVIPCTAPIDDVETSLANALVATVGSMWLQTNPEQVCQHLSHFF